MKINDISSNFFSLNSLKQSHLSKFAVNEKDALREVPESTEGLYRNAFQIDRDRIIHTNSFRRLKHKSQVFVAPDGDHYTTRLTHVIEVSQIGRTIARALNLNEDLVEAAALGHDLGHTPFGHIGESALNEILDNGFHHSSHSVKIIESLEKDGKGLNLTNFVIEAIKRHSKKQGKFLTENAVKGMTLEAQIVRIADALAYLSHDIEDAKRSNFIVNKKIPESIIYFFDLSRSDRINYFVTDVITNSWDCTGKTNISKPYIKMSDNVSDSMTELRDYMFENFYLPVSNSISGKVATKIIKFLFNYYFENQKNIPIKHIRKDHKEEEIISNFICGMTDHYAIKTAEDISPGITKNLRFKNI
ncbi:MAG: deoxyguanosinetriphosphate triphosphohydrolase [Chloroflexi bacterium]|nr:deoxyguanosinetriphosphate triphosphohydrolase [Chloroflexota bacterium]|tara:strand:+ start:6822 stop:7901 length:1080 start_codon:yes stop_codon:yes gene_type:complete